MQTDRDDPRNAVVPPTGSKATAPTAGEDDEDALDLRDLDVHGVEGVVARLRRDGDADPTPVAPPKRRIRAGRSPLLSIVVTVFGCWLLTTMFADFRYWLQSSEPRDLGDAGELAKNGRMPDGLHDTYARISGTPDVRHAARMTTSKNYVGYLRINEGGGSLFAAVPRSKDEPIRDEFESTFIGRMKQLDRDPGTAWLEQYLRDENIVRTIDAEPAALWKALEGGSDHIDTVEGARKLGAGERIRLVVHPPTRASSWASARTTPPRPSVGSPRSATPTSRWARAGRSTRSSRGSPRPSAPPPRPSCKRASTCPRSTRTPSSAPPCCPAQWPSAARPRPSGCAATM
ncbi:MAG: hypothetical protein IPN32_31835 [Deltaproteobacteria bacterium]|nr:hypothetical protein [Deltaproteobacteria bacterium]